MRDEGDGKVSQHSSESPRAGQGSSALALRVMAAAGGGPGGGGPEYSDHLAGTEPAWGSRGSSGRKEREEKQASEHLAPYTPNRDAFPPTASPSLRRGSSSPQKAPNPEQLLGAGARTSTHKKLRWEFRARSPKQASWNPGWSPRVPSGHCHRGLGILSQTCRPPPLGKLFPGTYPPFPSWEHPRPRKDESTRALPWPEVSALSDAFPRPTNGRRRLGARGGGSSSEGGTYTAGNAPAARCLAAAGAASRSVGLK